MKILSNPPENIRFHAYLLFFVICNVQIGVGIFDFERYIYQEAKHDAWLSVILAALFTHFVMWLIVHALSKYESTDLYGIHYDLFGKVIGTLFSCIYMLYYLFTAIVIMRNYVDVIQAWIFPDLSPWLIAFLLAILTIYAGFGGIRVIIGMCMIGFVVILFTVFLFTYSLKYAIWTQLLPIMESSAVDIIKGAIRMNFSLTGFEIMLLLYPYVTNKEHTMRYSQLALLFVNVVYLVIMVLSIVYFSSEQMLRSIWPSINMLKIVKYPFLERLEFMVISVWMLMVLTGILLNTWAITRGFKRMWNLNQKAMLLIVIALAFGITIAIHGHSAVKQVNYWLGNGSVIFSYIYPILLSGIVIIVFKFRGRKRSDSKGGTS
ncbi:GerAB/ArcD/ProY family transporter [Paenibacillus segetis]|uniref:Germination protein GerHB n=1 Tax=Paenibacillus segetis TaxID=1325360 RepID=A0ABQ1Y7G6_9BACL|nr:GerAB/ArcD/ProY family transporter [Paenibacillus segetis]GGH15264.1 germination protein GerHB [Paenibacillus segetis]